MKGTATDYMSMAIFPTNIPWPLIDACVKSASLLTRNEGCRITSRPSLSRTCPHSFMYDSNFGLAYL